MMSAEWQINSVGCQGRRLERRWREGGGVSIIPSALAEVQAPEPQRRWWHRRLVDVGGVLGAVLLMLLLAAGWLYFRSRPQLDGTVRLAGMQAPATIARDELGVVHITAQNLHDALFAEGYAMAQDRIFEMDLMRRRAEGRLAEVFGPRALPLDEAMRRLGLAAAAAAGFKLLGNAAGGELQAFSDGVNAYLNDNLSHLPLAFTFLRYRPRPWTDTDSLAITAYMDYVLTYNVRVKLAHARIEAALGPRLTRALYPEVSALDVLPGQLPGQPAASGRREQGPPHRRRPARGGASVRRAASGAAMPPLASLLPARWLLSSPADAPETGLAAGAGSNNWVLAPARSLNGKPILANDPHLPYQMPDIWWTVELSIVPPVPAKPAAAAVANSAATAAGKAGKPAAKAKANAAPGKPSRPKPVKRGARRAAGRPPARKGKPRRAARQSLPGGRARGGQKRGMQPFEILSLGAAPAPTGPLSVAGVALVGEPGVTIGHNDWIAWGMTNTGANVQQLVRYAIRLPLDGSAAAAAAAVPKPAPAHGQGRRHGRQSKAHPSRRQARPTPPQGLPLSPEQLGQIARGMIPPAIVQAIDNSQTPEIKTSAGWEPLEVRWQTIAVHGRPPVRYPVLLTPSGPIVGVIRGEVVAMDWFIKYPGALNTVDAFIALNQARNWNDFRSALAMYPGPALNFVFAGRDGSIGFQCAGWMPRRATFWRILPGDHPSPALDQGGWLPFRRLPSVYNPKSGLIATANGRIAPPPEARRLSREWEVPFRTHRIVKLLLARPRWHAAEMGGIQMDIHSRPEWEMAQALLAAAGRSQAAGETLPPAVQTALAALRAWNGEMSPGSAAPTLAGHTARALMQVVLTAKLGAGRSRQYSWLEWPLVWRRWLRQAPAEWLPPSYAALAKSHPRAAWDALLLGVFRSVAADYAQDPESWQWGRRHPLRLVHPFYSHLWLLSARADLGPEYISGGRWTVKVNTGGFGPSMRFIANLADWDRSTLTLPGGEAGEPLRAHYRDQFAAWIKGQGEPLWFSPAAVARHQRHLLTLTP